MPFDSSSTDIISASSFSQLKPKKKKVFYILQTKTHILITQKTSLLISHSARGGFEIRLKTQCFHWMELENSHALFFIICVFIRAVYT